MRLTKRLGLLAAAAAFTASTAAVAAPTFINILTGGTSGVYYPIVVALITVVVGFLFVKEGKDVDLNA